MITLFILTETKKAKKKVQKRSRSKSSNKKSKTREDYPSCKINFPRICKHEHHQAK